MEKTIYSNGYRLLIEWLKTERKRRNLTMREVGARLDVSHTWVVKIEKHDRRLDVAEYVRYCHILEVDPCTGTEILQQAMCATDNHSHEAII